jgi:hypothetical protein
VGIPRGMRSVILALTVVAAGCGGGGSAASPPRLPHALGSRLAAQADVVEAALARGDECGAASAAEGLRQAVTAAVAAGEVPVALRGPLARSADSLASEIVCTPAPPAQAPSGQAKPTGPGKHHGHDHKPKHGDGGDD